MKCSAAFVNYLILLYSVEISAQTFKAACKEFLKAPSFNIDYIVGQPWRTYYSWGLDMGTTCDDITFKKVTRDTRAKDRIAYNMETYMADHVIWDEAALFASKIRVSKQEQFPREMLLFPDNKQGSFKGVHNVNKLDVYLPKRSVPMLPFVFKFFRQGKFLVMADCSLDISVLMARSNDTIYRSEVLATAAEITQEEGYQACVVEKNKYEIEGLIVTEKIM